jgi:hypothetical protein
MEKYTVLYNSSFGTSENYDANKKYTTHYTHLYVWCVKQQKFYETMATFPTCNIFYSTFIL